MQDQGLNRDERKIFTIISKFEVILNNDNDDFFDIIRKVQENKVFQGKKHFEKILYMSYDVGFADRSEFYESQNNEIDQTLEQLLTASNYNSKTGIRKMYNKISTINKAAQDSNQSAKQAYTIRILIQYGETKCEEIINKIIDLLPFKIVSHHNEKHARSFIYKSFNHPHTDIFQYPKQNRFQLSNFQYGVQKTPSSQFYKIWNLQDLRDCYESQQDMYFVEFVHKVNFKGESEFFIFFTLKIKSYYVPFRIQFQIDSIYTNPIYQSDRNNTDFVMHLKINGYPKISKCQSIQRNIYHHYDLLDWQRTSNFLIGGLQNHSNLLKMQILQDHVIQLNISKKHLQENHSSFQDFISYFKSENKILDSTMKSSDAEKSFKDSPMMSAYNFLSKFEDNQKHQANNLQLLKIQLAKLIHAKIIDLEALNDLNVQKFIKEKLKKATLILQLMFLYQSEYSLGPSTDNMGLSQLFQNHEEKSVKELKQIVKNNLNIPENFCLINKIILTPTLAIYGQDELIPLSFQFSKSQFYENEAIIYIRDDDIKQFDFEETNEAYFNESFKRYFSEETIINIKDLKDYYITQVTNKSLHKNCFFANNELIQNQIKASSFLEFLSQCNIKHTQPLYTLQLEKLYIEGQHSDIGFANFKLLDRIFKGMGVNYENKLFSSMLINCQYKDGETEKNHLCTIFYSDLIYSEQFAITFKEKKQDQKIVENITIQVFRIYNCKKEGFINQSNLGDFITRKDLIKEQIQQETEKDQFFKGLELSIQLKEVTRQDKISRLKFYLNNNTYPIKNSYIVSGRKAIDVQDNIFDKSNTMLLNNFSIKHVQLRIPDKNQIDNKKILVAKKRGIYIGKFYAFNAICKDAFSNNIDTLNQSIILFHPDLIEYYLWPELYSQNEDPFENNQMEYVVIADNHYVNEEVIQFSEQMFEKQTDEKSSFNNQKQDVQSNNILTSNHHYSQNPKKYELGPTFLKSIIKTNIKPQALLLFSGELIKTDQEDESTIYERKNYRLSLFEKLNMDSRPFDLKKFKEEKKHYDFYISQKYQLNHIINSLQYKSEGKKKENNQIESLKKENKQIESLKNKNIVSQKNKKIQDMTNELQSIIEKELQTLNSQAQSQQLSYFKFRSYREIKVEKELIIPKDLLEICIKKMKVFYQKTNNLNQQEILQRIENSSKKNLICNYNAQLARKKSSSIYYLDLVKFTKIYKGFLIKDIAQELVDYFNEYFKVELNWEKYAYQYHQMRNSTKYKNNEANYISKTAQKWNQALFDLLNEAMYLINFYYVVENTELHHESLQNLKDDLKELKDLAQQDLQNLIFYYSVFPKIIKSIEYNFKKSTFFVKNKIQDSIENIEEQNYLSNSNNSEAEDEEEFDDLYNDENIDILGTSVDNEDSQYVNSQINPDFLNMSNYSQIYSDTKKMDVTFEWDLSVILNNKK